MAILSNLLSATEPKGFWITIIKAFESFTNNYVLAIILITLILRVVWAFVEIGMKYNAQRMAEINEKMQPEMEKLKQKYEKQPQVLQQKQNELQKKHFNGKTYAMSCLTMLITQGLNLFIFFTLFAGLNGMASYKNSLSYDSIKYTYVNCINVTDEYLSDNSTVATYEEKLDYFADYENMSFLFRTEEEPASADEGAEIIKVTYVDIVYTAKGQDPVVLYTAKYKDKQAFTTTKIILPETEENPEGEGTQPLAEEEQEEPKTIEVTNENIIALIEKYFPVYTEGEEEGSKEVVIGKITQKDKEGNDVEVDLYLSTAIQNIAINNVVEVYDQTREGFLWIKNIWIADSTSKSIPSYSSLEGQIGKKNIEEGEKTIYNAFMPELKKERSEANGCFLITILTIATSLFTMYLLSIYNKQRKIKKGKAKVQLVPRTGFMAKIFKSPKKVVIEENKTNKGMWTKIIVPVIFGVFSLIYNSVFALYLLTGQVVAMITTVPQTMLIDNIIDKQNKKKEEKTKVTVDYARKF